MHCGISVLFVSGDCVVYGSTGHVSDVFVCSRPCVPLEEKKLVVLMVKHTAAFVL